MPLFVIRENWRDNLSRGASKLLSCVNLLATSNIFYLLAHYDAKNWLVAPESSKRTPNWQSRQSLQVVALGVN